MVLFLLVGLIGLITTPAAAEVIPCVVTDPVNSADTTGTLNYWLAALDTVGAPACGTITFNGDMTVLGPIQINRDVTIDGETHNVAIADIINGETVGHGLVVVGDFLDTLNPTVTLKNLSLTDGVPALEGSTYGLEYAPIENYGTLTLDHVRVQNNFGAYGSIYNMGLLNITDGYFSTTVPNVLDGSFYSNGIFNLGALNVTGTSFSGNVGTIYNSTYSGNFLPTATITDSTFANSMGNRGQGLIWNEGGPSDNGNNYGGTLVVTNSTFSGNTTTLFPDDPGLVSVVAIRNMGNMSLTNNTFADNRGVGAITLLSADQFSLYSNTLTNNVFVEAADLTQCAYNVYYPLLVNDSRNNLFTGYCGRTDLPTPTGFTLKTPTEINLGTLGNYGGATQTIPLLPGSVAIDAGDGSQCPDSDQRGVTRPQGAACDIGAYEYEHPAVTLDHFFLAPEPSLAGYPMLSMQVDFAAPVDNHSGETAIPYTCTVDYGDGAVRAGEVMSRDGHFVYVCFGDEQYVYDSEGTYNITFTIKDLVGVELAAFTTQHTVTLPNRGYITFAPTPVLVDSPTSFTTSADGYDVYYWYVIDEENGGMGQTSQITFTEAGMYKVMLIAMKYEYDGTNWMIQTLADGVEVEVILQAPVPVLSTISPAAAPAESSDLVLTVTGSDLAPTSLVRWNGIDLATTYVSATELSALIPASNLANVQTAQVTVFTPAPGGGTSATLAFFVTQAAAGVTSQDVANGTDPSAAVTPATASATGDGLLVVAEYDANPGGTPSFSASGVYFDVYAAPGNTFSQVEIVACGMNASEKLFWWNTVSQKWLKASPQSYDMSTGCITLIVTESSSPSLSQLQGTYFATGIELPLYQSTGFTAPVDLGGILNAAKAGQMIPLKWRLLDASGNPVIDLDPSTVKLTVSAYACQTNLPTDAIETYTSGTSSLQNLGNGYYQLNWKTEKTYANTCKQIRLTIGAWTSDGLTALFKFSK